MPGVDWAAAGAFPGEVEIVVALNRCTDRTEEIAPGHGAKVVRGDGEIWRGSNAAARAATRGKSQADAHRFYYDFER